MSQLDWLDLEERIERRESRMKAPRRPEPMTGRSVYTLREVLRQKKRR
jgi:hypothetical protein